MATEYHEASSHDFGMTPAKQEAFLKLARDRFQLAEKADHEQRQRELDDLRFYAGEQWDSDLLQSRSGQTIGSGSNQQIVPARPSLVINKTREPVRQVLNAERQSDLGIELVPADDFGEASGPIDHSEIELREGLVRRIQRDSEASDARTWAFSRATIAGRGYWRVMTRYVPGKSADQEVYIDRIYNQSTVLLDPSHEQADGSDMNWSFDGTDLLWSQFKVEYPDAKVSQIGENDSQWRTLGDQAPNWFTGEGDKRSVRVMNYYYSETKNETVYHLSNGAACYKDEVASLPEGVTVLKEDVKELCHTEQKRSIKWAKIVGNEVLEQTDWPGRWVPIIKTVGEELQPYDQQRRCEGIVRPMRDPCKGNNYIISKFVERVGLTAIAPIMMAGGQDESYEDEYDAINTRTLGRVHYNQKDEFDNPAPPPFKLDSRADIADIGMGLSLFGQAIQSTSVVPETALGNIDPSVKSGKLAKALIEQGERGTSNFLDNLVRSLRHEARIINDLLYPIYGRPGRLARMVNNQGEMSAVIIDQPFTMQGEGKQARPVPVQGNGAPPAQPAPAAPPTMAGGQAQPQPPAQPEVKHYKLTKDADFNVAVKVTKTIETRRMQIAQFLGELIAASPEQMAIVGDKLWKYLDVPDHEEIEERYKVMLAPAIQQLIAGGDQAIPPQAQAKMAELTQQNQELQQLADKNKTDLDKAQLAASADIMKAKLEIASREQMAREANETKLAVAELGAKVDRLGLFYEERARLGDQAHDATMDGMDKQHEAEMAAQGQQNALEQVDQQQENTLEQGAQGHEQALEQAEQAAALAPEPSTGGE